MAGMLLFLTGDRETMSNIKKKMAYQYKNIIFDQ
jgi:hypothetical protein